MKRLIILIISVTILGCTTEDQSFPDEFDFGKTESGLYTNDFFNLEISFDPNWIVQDEQQMNNLIEMGEELMSGGNENFKTAVKAAQVNTAYLLTLFKYEVGSTVEFNPSFMVVAENTKNFPGIKTGKDYLFHAKRSLGLAAVDYYFEKEVFEKTIGETTFYVLEAKFDFLNNTIIQEYIATVTNGFSLGFIATYSTEDQRKELYEIINHIKL